VIARERHLGALSGLLERHPVVALLGARQVGKTTLALELLRRRGERGVRFAGRRRAPGVFSGRFAFPGEISNTE
jgi:AAA+ ATPase superfamily predicted ATPase